MCWIRRHVFLSISFSLFSLKDSQILLHPGYFSFSNNSFEPGFGTKKENVWGRARWSDAGEEDKERADEAVWGFGEGRQDRREK
jgi:hypothetical protein